MLAGAKFCIWDQSTEKNISSTNIIVVKEISWVMKDKTYVDSTEMIFISRDLVMVNVEWGTGSSIMEEADSMRRHSPTNPITDGSTSSTSR